MAVTIEMHNTGDAGLKQDVVAMVEHVLFGSAGDWVPIIGSQEKDWWEMKILGANAFERSYTLEGGRGARPSGYCRHRFEDGSRLG